MHFGCLVEIRPGPFQLHPERRVCARVSNAQINFLNTHLPNLIRYNSLVDLRIDSEAVIANSELKWFNVTKFNLY